MTRGHYSRPKRSLALMLALSLLLPSAAMLLMPVAASAQAAEPTSAADLAAIHMPTVPPTEGPIHTILMFPFVNGIPASAPANGFNGDIVGARVENAIKMRLNVIGRYKADSFSPTLPQMQRAVQDSGLEGISETDIAPPYDTAQKGRKLADQVATDGYLLGTVESITTDTQSRTVSLLITATLYNTETGVAVKVLAASGHGISYNTVDDPAALLQSAINDAAGKVVSALNADTMQGRQAFVPDVRHRHRSNAGTIVLGVLLAAAIAIGITAAHHSSHNSSGTTTTTTTTTPVTVVAGNPPPVPF
ncbi:MAG: hypothetical protein ACRYFS_22935 [Janthinobacterium lividum]